MKKVFVFVAFAIAIGAFSEVKAQDFRGSIGLELALPLGDFGDAYSLGYGLSAGGELPFGDNLAATVTVGYVLLAVDSELSDLVKSAAMIPAQLGVKYYFSEQQSGPYAHGQIGIHSRSVTTEDFDFLGVTIEGETTSDSNLSWAIGAGFFVNENIDLGLRFNSISGKDDADASSYIGVRAAFNF